MEFQCSVFSNLYDVNLYEISGTKRFASTFFLRPSVPGLLHNRCRTLVPGPQVTGQLLQADQVPQEPGTGTGWT